MVLSKLGSVMLWACTLPYYRVFHFNTLDPIQRIAAYTQRPDAINSLAFSLSQWRSRKIAELQFISVAVRFVHEYISFEELFTYTV